MLLKTNSILGHVRSVRLTNRLVASGATCVQHTSRSSYSVRATSDKEPDCPELPDTPSWSLQSILKNRDISVKSNQPDSEEITPQTVDRLLRLAHLQSPTDPKELERLQRDVIRMRNFLDYIRANSVESQQCLEAEEEGEVRFPLKTAPDLVKGLRSLVDDGQGLRTRETISSNTNDSTEALQDQEKDGMRRREILLASPKRVKGNFFVVGAELDPKDGN